MADKILKELTLKIWRQKDAKSKGGFETYKIHDISTGSSFLEMLDILNEQLVSENKEPVAFDHDCREGICGTCSLFIDGRAHGPDDDVTTCQLHMRRFEDGATITIEPWRCGAFPVIKDLIVDRGAYEKILQAGAYVSVNTGGVPDGNAIPIGKPAADEAMDAAACIGCGACAATCKNFSWLLKFPSWLFFRKERSKLLAVLKLWWLKWTNSDSVTAPTREPANQNVRRASLSNTSLV